MIFLSKKYVLSLFTLTLSLYTWSATKSDVIKQREDCKANKVDTWYCDNNVEDCNELINFSPDEGPGYQQMHGHKYSFIRRHTMKLVKYASGMVYCQARNWKGIGGTLGLGDMSESDGSVPKGINKDGEIYLRHPKTSHILGKDVDIAYYQLKSKSHRRNKKANYLDPVCDHGTYKIVDGKRKFVDQYHCISKPYNLDKWRTALFIAYLHDSNQFIVAGVDGKIGPIIRSSIQALCHHGYYEGKACRTTLLGYETEPGRSGWYRYHHHHLHLKTDPYWKPLTRNERLNLSRASFPVNSLMTRDSFNWDEPLNGYMNSFCITENCTPLQNAFENFNIINVKE